MSPSPARTRTARHLRLARRALLALLSSVLIAPLLAGVAGARLAAATAPTSSSVEADLYSLTNASRSSAGLAALQNDPAAAAVAREWSAQMSAANSLQHNPNLQAQVNSRVTSAWQRIGENVGVGYSASGLHDAFMASTGHRANILGDFNRVGVGAVVEPSGRMWVTLVFIKGPALAAPSYSPIGRLDSLRADANGMTVQGWTIDLDTTAPLEIDVLVNGRLVGWGSASTYRPDVGAVYPAYGDRHGFSFTTPAVGGTNTVCVYAINVGGGINTNLGCQTITISANPVGFLDVIRQGPGSASAYGWALDPQTTAPIEVHVWVDGRFAGWTSAAGNRPDVGAAFPGYGDAHGFGVTFPIDGGVHQVCVYGINVGIGTNTLLACQTLYVSASPIGQLDGLLPLDGSLVVDGWGLDPQTTAPIEVHVLVDGRFVGWGYASYLRPDVGSAYPAYGPGRGFSFRAPAVTGTHQVCIYGINVGAGINTLLGCRQISM